jgi:hypothetical protein
MWMAVADEMGSRDLIGTARNRSNSLVEHTTLCNHPEAVVAFGVAVRLRDRNDDASRRAAVWNTPSHSP